MGGPRVLVVGGTGAFGRRLVEGLAATVEATVIVAGRDAASSRRFASEVAARWPGARIESARLDRSSATQADVATLDPAVVVDAAGSFQGGNLGFVRAVIAAGRHYVDLADARDFVAAFPTLDDEARAAGVTAIAGASSTPALSHAALDALTRGWTRVDRVEIAISPGNRAPRGLSVMKAILSYAGRPIRVLRDGRWTDAPGWGLLARRTMPGLGPRILSLCETPDLDLVAARFPEARTVLFRAGLELAPLHLGLWIASLAVRAGLVRDLPRHAERLRHLAAAFERFGTDRGGMSVEAEGLDAAGDRAHAVWSLVAEAGDGPAIPTLPALAFIRALLAGRPPAPPGAHVAAGLLDLPAFAAEAGRYTIRTRIDRASPDAASAFRRALGGAVDHLPRAVRAVHDGESAVELQGTADVEGPSGSFGRVIGRLFGFPAAGRDAPARIRLARGADGRETWTRRIGGSTFVSSMAAGEKPAMLAERFGPFRFDLAIDETADGFSLAVRGWRLLGLPLPAKLAPSTAARAFQRPDGAYGFDVRIEAPIIGRIVRYSGRVTPVDGGLPPASHRQMSMRPMSR